MQHIKPRKSIILIIFIMFFPLLYAQEGRAGSRSTPLDVYLIIDGSAAFQQSKEDAIGWINNQLVNRILSEGDTITIWNAGDSANIIHSGTISSAADRREISDKLQALNTGGRRADFSSALQSAATRAAQTGQSRIPYTMLVTASAEGLEQTLTGSAQNLLRWSRSEKYEKWQVLVVAPDIAARVREAAASYMGR